MGHGKYTYRLAWKYITMKDCPNLHTVAIFKQSCDPLPFWNTCLCLCVFLIHVCVFVRPVCVAYVFVFVFWHLFVFLWDLFVRPWLQQVVPQIPAKDRVCPSAQQRVLDISTLLAKIDVMAWMSHHPHLHHHHLDRWRQSADSNPGFTRSSNIGRRPAVVGATLI